MPNFLKLNLWKLIYLTKDVHLGISLRLRKILQQVTYKNEQKPTDLEDYEVHINIAAYNQEHWIGETLKAIQAQTFSNWKVFVVDDGSTDETVRVVRNFAIADDRIHLYRNDKNQGLNLTRNVGLKLAQQNAGWNVLAIVDGDDVPYPYWLELGLKGIKNGASVVRCTNTRCSVDLSEKYYDYMTCSQIFATREIIDIVGFYRPQPFREDFDYMERLEKAAFKLGTFVVATPKSCQLMRLSSHNITSKPKDLVQTACDEYAKKLVKEAATLSSLHVGENIPSYSKVYSCDQSRSKSI